MGSTQFYSWPQFLGELNKSSGRPRGMNFSAKGGWFQSKGPTMEIVWFYWVSIVIIYSIYWKAKTFCGDNIHVLCVHSFATLIGWF